MASDKQIIIERVFEAPRERVWKAWTEADEVKKWWGPAGFTAPHVEIDFKVGGKYLYAMHGPAGTEFDRDLWSAGEYKEIVPLEKIVVSDYFSDEHGNKMNPSEHGLSTDMPAEMDVTVKFEELDGGNTKLSIIYPVPQTEAQYQAMKNSGMEQGWGTSLDKLADSLK